MALARTQREWSILVGEYNICKKKLESKREALKIITKEWQSTQRERDIYKNKINQLQQDLDRYILKEKRQPKDRQQASEVQEKKNQNHVMQSPDFLGNCTSKIPPQGKETKYNQTSFAFMKNENRLRDRNWISKESLVQLLLEYKEVNKALRKDLVELKKLYVESQEDVQILRERMRKKSPSSSTDDETSPTFVVEGREAFISQLEEYKEQVASLEQELKSIKDESSDVSTERDHYKDKCERLNTQLNYILGADDRRLVDVDALVLDNKYLKEKVAQLEEERNLEKESIQKYEAVFEKKKNKLLRQVYTKDRLPPYNSKYTSEHSLKTVTDLRNVANVLSETITEKNLALSHQRSANRILGKRVNELENKLKTLEVAGLWSLPGHRGYGSINFESNDTDVNTNSEGTSNIRVGPVTPVEKLEWDHSQSLVKLTDLERTEGKTEINGKCSEVQEVSKSGRIFETPDLLSKSTKKRCVLQNSLNNDSDTDDSGCQDGCLHRRIFSRSLCFEELHERREDGTFVKQSFPSPGVIHDGPCLMENSAIRKLSRSNSAPCFPRRESFEEKVHVDGELSPGSAMK